MNAFSHSAEYAIRAMTYLGLQRGEAFSLVRDMSARLSIPPAFLVKVLQPLVARGFVESRRGRGGGYRLGRPPAQLSLFQIVDAIDYLAQDPVCALGQATCSDERACPIHAHWKEAFVAFRRYLLETTLDDLVQFCRARPEAGYPGPEARLPSAADVADC